MSRDSFDDLPILAELRGQLEVRARHASGWPGWAGRLATHLRRGLGAVPVLIGTATAVAVLVLALTVVKPGHHSSTPGGTHPTPGHPSGPRPPAPASPTGPTSAESKAIAKSDARVAKRDPACVQRVNAGKTLSHASPVPALLSRLGVLRRPAAPHDAAWQRLFNNGWDVGAEVDVDYIREARTSYGKAFFLIPEGHITPFGAISPRCYKEQRAELKRELKRRNRPASPKVVAATLTAQADNVKVQRLQTAHRAGLCFAAVSLHSRRKMGGVDMGCTPETESLRGDLAGGIGEGDRAGGTILGAIVPDGVASVTLHFPAGNGAPARDVSSTAVNNVVVFKIPPHTYHASFPASIIRRDAAGRVIH